jgi:alcohol dehydrogenase (cytochrome c)
MRSHPARCTARACRRALTAPIAALLFAIVAFPANAQVTHERLLNAQSEPENWLHYNGSYNSHHYSGLDQVTPENATDLEMKWVFQARSLEKFEAIPLVVDGVMYLTEAPNTIVALDAATGREFWEHVYELPPQTTECCGKINRGVAVLGDTVFMGTLDSHLIAVDRFTGSRKWDVKLADYRMGYAIAVAPLAIKDKVIVGMAGGEKGIQGFLAAFDAETGKQAWRFNTIPQPGEKGHETWETDAWKTGGASIWVTGSYDPDSNLTSGASAIRDRTGTATCVPATTCSAIRWWRLTRIRAS